MKAVDARRLEALYAGTDDPWDFRTSAYEHEKFAATAAALPRERYASTLEIGCGNGELARRLAPSSARYMGVDAVETALAAARRAVPGASFSRLFLPAQLPEGEHDLIVLSEILYFLDPDTIAGLAEQIATRWPKADVVCVTWLGDSGTDIPGLEALARFVAAHPGTFRCAVTAPGYRVDVRRAPR